MNLLSTRDLAERLNVDLSTVSNWIRRYPDFPRATFHNQDHTTRLYTNEDVTQIIVFLNNRETVNRFKTFK